MDTELIPYNTGRVKIGIRYVPHPRTPEMDDDTLLLQRALLGEQSDIQKITSFIKKRIGEWL
jgi:hypothetical protein